MNNKYIFLLCFLGLVTGIKGQVKIALSYDEEKEREMKRIEQAKLDSIENAIYQKAQELSYDSLVEYPVKNGIYGMVGQTLIVPPSNYKIQDGDVISGFFKEATQNNIYEPGYTKYRSKYGTKYESVSGRRFKVQQIIDDVNYPENVCYLELKDEKGTIYYRFYKNYKKPDFPFYIEGYIIKQASIKKQQNLQYAKCINMDEYTGSDFYTGKTIRFYVGQLWRFKEFIIDSNSGELVELYTNNKGETFKPSMFGTDFKTKKESDRIKAKYGQAIWKQIMTYTIQKGMSKSAVRESWGDPVEINESSYGEQWVYRDKYVYFKNGRVTGWN